MRILRTVLHGFIVLAALSTAACSGAPTEEDSADAEEALATQAPITNFHYVRAGLFRGAHPTKAGLEYLKQRGVKTIVNLEATGIFEPASTEDIDTERTEAASLGIRFVYKPMSSFLPVDSGTVNSILSTLDAGGSGAVYVHCTHGQDRTGLIVGLERVEHERWTPKAAHTEMLKYGFHPILENLNHYFEERTGFED